MMLLLAKTSHAFFTRGSGFPTPLAATWNEESSMAGEFCRTAPSHSRLLLAHADEMQRGAHTESDPVAQTLLEPE